MLIYAHVNSLLECLCSGILSFSSLYYYSPQRKLIKKFYQGTFSWKNVANKHKLFHKQQSFKRLLWN